jgi:hypothetical protein
MLQQQDALISSSQRHGVLVHLGTLRQSFGLLCFTLLFYASANAHSAFRDEP